MSFSCQQIYSSTNICAETICLSSTFYILAWRLIQDPKFSAAVSYVFC